MKKKAKVVFTASLPVIAIAGLTLVPPASADGGQYVRTQSGRVRCLVSASGVGTGAKGPVVICAASSPMSPPFDQWENSGFLNAPMGAYGSRYHAAVVEAAGNFSFQDGGNIDGSQPGNDLVLNYGMSYSVQGWTINPGPDGTRFTNNATGHGMFVSIENTYGF